MELGDLLRRLLGDGASLRRLHPAYQEASALFSASLAASPDEIERTRAVLMRRAWGWLSSTEYGRTVGDESAFAGLSRQIVSKAPAQFMSRSFGLRAHTGGSSGIPLTLKRSPTCIAVEQAAIDHVLSTAGVDSRRARIAVLRAQPLGRDGSGQPRIARRVSRRLLYLSPYALTEDTVCEYARVLSEYRPDLLMAYPSAVENLVALLEGRGIACQIPVVMTSSEMLYEPARELLARNLRAKVVDLYGNGERVAMAYSVRPRQYWFLPLYGGVTLQISERNVEVGGAVVDVYEIVGTAFWNACMPLYRYSTGDLAVLPRGLDVNEVREVELGKRPFIGILGRTDEWVRLRSGARAIGLNHLPWGVPGLKRMQVIEDAPGQLTLILDVVPGMEDRARTVVRRNAAQLFGEDAEVKIEIGRPFVRSRTGKIPFVVRRDGS